MIKKNQHWQTDQDYYNSLSSDDKKFLNKFNLEFYGGDFRTKKGEKNIHPEEMRKDCYNRNNSNNRDIFNNEKMEMVYIDSTLSESEGNELDEPFEYAYSKNNPNHNFYEDSINNFIDYKNNPPEEEEK